MRLTLLLEKSQNQVSELKGQGFLFKMDLTNENNKIECSNCIIFEKELTPKNIANMLYLKYGELFDQGIKVAIVNNKNPENDKLKNGLILLKKIFPKNSFVMTHNKKLNSSEQTSLKLQKILDQSEKIKQDKESVYIQPIVLKNEKKSGYAITHYKNGHIVNQESGLFNRGIMVAVKDRIKKLDYILSEASEDAQIYVCVEKKGDMSNLNDIKSHFKKRFEKNIIIETNPLMNKNFKNEIAKIKYKEYLEKLNKELLNKENVVVFTDGGRRDFIGMSSYVIVNGKETQSKSFVSGKEQSAFNEQIAMLSALNETMTNPDLKDRKIHFVCDSDELYDVYKSLTEPNIKIRTNIRGLREFKVAKTLVKEHKNKIYFHFVKSHQKVNDFMTYGNDAVDKLNLIRLRKASEELDAEELSSKYKGAKLFNEYVGDVELDFYNGLTRSGNIKAEGSYEIVRDLKDGNKRPKKRISGNKVKVR